MPLYSRLRRNIAVLPVDVQQAVSESAEDQWTTDVASALHNSRDDFLSTDLLRAVQLTRKMCDAGYTIRGGVHEADILEPLYHHICNADLLRSNPTLHRTVCSAFRRCAGASDGNWHLQTHDPRNPTLPWKPLLDLIDTVFLGRNSMRMNKRIAQTISDNTAELRKVILEARMLFPPEATSEIWTMLRSDASVNDCFFWARVSLLLPTSRLFATSSSPDVALRQVETVDEILRTAFATAHWHSSSGTVRLAILRVIRRLWVAFLTTDPQFIFMDRLVQIFDRSTYVREVFHIAFWSLRVPIGDPNEVSGGANVADSSLYFGRKGGTVRVEVADTLAALVTDDEDDVFWELFDQLCRVVEVHATAVSTRRSQYALSFLSSFVNVVSRRVNASAVPFRRLSPGAQLSTRSLHRIADKLLPFAEVTLFGDGAQHALNILSACAFLKPTAQVAAATLRLCELGLQANEETHQVGGAARLLSAVVSHFIYEKTLRCPRVRQSVEVSGARQTIVDAVPTLLGQLLSAADPNNVTKLEPCLTAACRLLTCISGAGMGASLSPTLLGETFRCMCLAFRTGALKSTVDTVGSNSAIGAISSHLAGIFATVASSIVTEEQALAVMRVLEHEFLSATQEHAELFKVAARGVGLFLPSQSKEHLIDSLLTKGSNAAIDESERRRSLGFVAELIKSGPYFVNLSIGKRVLAQVDELLEEINVDAKKQKKTVQIAGKLLRALVNGLLVTPPVLSTKETESCFPSKSSLTLTSPEVSPEARAFASDIVIKYFTNAMDQLAAASSGPDRFSDASFSRALSSLLMLRYTCAGHGVALLRGKALARAPFEAGASATSGAINTLPWWRRPLTLPGHRTLSGEANHLGAAANKVMDYCIDVVQSDISEASTVMVKTLRVGLKVLAVMSGHKSVDSGRINAAWDAVSSFGALTTSDQYHYPASYFVSVSHMNVMSRGQVMAPLFGAVGRRLYTVLCQLSMCRLKGVRVAAQILASVVQRSALTTIPVADVIALNPIFDLVTDPSTFESRPDYETAGIYHSLTQLSDLMEHPHPSVARLLLQCAKTMIVAKEHDKVSNEDRRNRFFSELNTWLRRISRPQDIAEQYVEHLLPMAAAAGVPTVTEARCFAALENLLPDADTKCKDTTYTALLRGLEVTAARAADVTASRTRAADAMVQLLALFVAKRDRVLSTQERLEVNGKSYAAVETGALTGAVFPAVRKLYELDPNTESEYPSRIRLQPHHAAAGRLIWALIHDANDVSLPSPWLRKFIEEKCVSIATDSFNGTVVLVVKQLIQVASQAPELNGDRHAPAMLILNLAEGVLKAAVEGKQDQEQLHRGSVAAAVTAGVWRACKTLRVGGGKRESILIRIIRMFETTIMAPNLSNTVSEYFAAALPHMTRCLDATEFKRITDFFSMGITQVADQGQSQLVVRLLQFMSALCVLGMSREQCWPLLDCVRKHVNWSISGNHQVRRAAVSLLYSFFCLASYCLPEWTARRAIPASALLVDDDLSRRVRQLRLDSLAQLLPTQVEGNEDPERILIAGKTFVGAVMGNQDFVAFGSEGAVTQGLFTVAAYDFPDGDTVAQTLTDCAKAFAFQLHPKAACVQIVDTCCQALRDPQAHRRAKQHAATILRIVVYQNQLQFDATERFELVRQSMEALRMNAEHVHRPLRNEIRLTFCVLTRLLPVAEIGSLVAKYIKSVKSENVSDTTMVLAAAFVADSFPEAVPEFMPKLLCKLARWTTLPTFAFASSAAHADVTVTIRDVLNKWWRVHRDLWHYKHKERFSESQQEALMDHFLSHSYYV